MGFYSNGTMMPMIGADVERVKSLKPIADKIAKMYGRPYEIRYFNVKDVDNQTTV